MIGKVWIFITAFSFITYVHHARSACMYNDLKTHLDDHLLEEHIFEMKVFSSETKEHELLSVVNTLCSSWTKNRNKNNDNLKVLQTFELMLNAFFLDKFEKYCVTLNCTDDYTVSLVNTTVFGDMYTRTCNGPTSDLKCPSKSSTTIRPTSTAVERTTFFTMVDSITTAHTSRTSLTTVSPNITAPANLSTVSSAPTETLNQALKEDNQNLWSTVKTFYGVLVFSLLLNIALILLVLKLKYFGKATQTNACGEAILLQVQGVDN